MRQPNRLVLSFTTKHVIVAYIPVCVAADQSFAFKHVHRGRHTPTCQVTVTIQVAVASCVHFQGDSFH